MTNSKHSIHKRTWGVGLVVTIAALLSCGLGQASADGWLVYGHDLNNSRDAGSQGPTVGQASSLKQAWVFNSPTGNFTGTPAVAGGIAVAGDSGGSVYALRASTGHVLWSRNFGQPINGSAAIDPTAGHGGVVFIPIAQIGGPRLVALSLRDGQVRWDATLTTQPTSDVFGSPTYWHGTVYMGTSGPLGDGSTARGTVTALNERTGAIRWQTFTVPAGDDGGPVWSTPAIEPRTGRLYVGTGNAYHPPAAGTTDSMMALDAATGRILGNFQATVDDTFDVIDNPVGPDFDFGASPNLLRAANGEALVGEGSKDGRYYALDRQTLQPAWQAVLGAGSGLGGVLGSTAYDGTRVYGAHADTGVVTALSPNGAVDWTSQDHGMFEWSPLAVGNGVLYTVDPTGLLVARNASTGTILTSLALGAPSSGGVSIAGDRVFVSVGQGFGPQPGSIVAFSAAGR